MRVCVDDKQKIFYENINFTVGDPKISIYMVTYNELANTKVALDFMFAFTTIPFDLYLWDNHSHPNMVEMLKYYEKLISDGRMIRQGPCKNFTVIYYDRNIGKANAHDTMFKDNRTDYCVFMDGDVAVTEDWAELMIKGLECTEFDVLAPYIELQGSMPETEFGIPKDKLFKHYNGIEIWKTYRVAGALLMMRSDIYKKMGGYAPGLNMAYGGDDATLCEFSGKRGLKLGYLKKPRVYHLCHQDPDYNAWKHHILSDQRSGYLNRQGKIGYYEYTKKPYRNW